MRQIRRIAAKATLLFVVALLAAGPVYAHAHLEQSTPAADSVVASAPASVLLKFTEPVEVGFSTFKVYPLPAGADGESLKDAAAKLVDEVLGARGDEEARADAGVAGGSGTSAEVEIRMKEGLEPGAYVVMWRVLSVDSHTTRGHFVFQYQP